MTVLRTMILVALMLSLSAALAQESENEVVISRERAPLVAKVKLSTVATDFQRPLYVTHAGDGSGRLFLVEQGGKIWILRDGLKSAQPFLDVSPLITPDALTNPYTEQGLLGLAFHPDYADNGIFFVNYTDHDGNTAVARYHVSEHDPESSHAESGQIVLQVPQPFAAHNGGHIAFGPDGYLYITLGDGGDANDPLRSGQDRGTLLGAILRIDVEGAPPYSVPTDNPFVGDKAARDEIWVYGLRNAWRFSFDRATGDLYLGDVGQHQWEEVNFQLADSSGGENFGWNAWEGSHKFTHVWASDVAPDHVPPFFEYSHSLGCSVTGGYVYRGAAIPDLEAVYLFGDYCTGRIWASWRDHDLNWQTEEYMDTELNISSFGEDEAGELYVLDYAGTLFRFDPAGA